MQLVVLPLNFCILACVSVSSVGSALWYNWLGLRCGLLHFPTSSWHSDIMHGHVTSCHPGPTHPEWQHRAAWRLAILAPGLNLCRHRILYLGGFRAPDAKAAMMNLCRDQSEVLSPRHVSAAIAVSSISAPFWSAVEIDMGVSRPVIIGEASAEPARRSTIPPSWKG